MKKIIILMVAMVMLSASQVFARYDQTHKLLKDSAGTSMVDCALASGVAKYSETLNTEKSGGFVAILITEDKAGGGGNVDISAEYSLDGTNFYTAYVSNMSGTITAEGNIATALGNVTRWIIYTPRPSKYSRLKFDPNADSQITAVYTFVESK